jgi:hypothetical protein
MASRVVTNSTSPPLGYIELAGEIPDSVAVFMTLLFCYLSAIADAL